jgi:hypothetical protein
MTTGRLETRYWICPNCENPSARSISEHHEENVLVDYFPLKDEAVHRMVLHLKELAECPEDHDAKKVLAIPTAVSQSPLWDWEVDG